MLDIVICYTILRLCLEVDAFTASDEQLELIRRVRKHRMVLSEKL